MKRDRQRAILEEFIQGDMQPAFVRQDEWRQQFAWSWCVRAGLATGQSGGKPVPCNGAFRSQATTFLYVSPEAFSQGCVEVAGLLKGILEFVAGGVVHSVSMCGSSADDQPE